MHLPFILTTRHKVEDYTTWKAHFDAHVDMRKAAGEKSYHIFHLEGDPNDLVLLFEWDSLENFRRYSQSEELREAMKESSVVSEPQMLYLEEIKKNHLNHERR
jgi:quinol monooxygenase YgiN